MADAFRWQDVPASFPLNAANLNKGLDDGPNIVRNSDFESWLFTRQGTPNTCLIPDLWELVRPLSPFVTVNAYEKTTGGNGGGACVRVRAKSDFAAGSPEPDFCLQQRADGASFGGYLTIGCWVKIEGTALGTEVCGIRINSSYSKTHTVTAGTDVWEWLEVTALNQVPNQIQLWATKPTSGEFKVLFSNPRMVQGERSGIWTPNLADRLLECPYYDDGTTFNRVRGPRLLAGKFSFDPGGSVATLAVTRVFTAAYDQGIAGSSSADPFDKDLLPATAAIKTAPSAAELEQAKFTHATWNYASKTLTLNFKRTSGSNFGAGTYTGSYLVFGLGRSQYSGW